MLKIATGSLFSTATCSAMLSAIAVEVAVARGNAGDVRRIVLVVQQVDALHDLSEQRLDFHEALTGPGPRLGDLEDLRFGLIEQLTDLLAHAVQSAIGDLGRDLDEFPQDRAFAHDLGVAPDVVGRRRASRERRQVGDTPGLVLVLARFYRLVDSDHVGRLALFDETGNVAENPPVIVPIKVIAADIVAHLVEGAVVDEQPPQHRLLRVDRVRRQLEVEKLGIGGGLGRSLSHESDRWDCGHSTTKRNKKAASAALSPALLARCYCCAVSPNTDTLMWTR